MTQPTGNGGEYAYEPPYDYTAHARKVSTTYPYVVTAPCTKALDSASEVCPSCFRIHPQPVPAACPECHGTGAVEAPGCNCGTGPSGYYGAHESGCGLEPCPRGCPYVPPSRRGSRP